MPRVPTKPDDERWDPEQLRELHMEICRRVSLGQKNNVIASDLGITSQHVGNVRNSLSGRLFIDELQSEMNEGVVDISKRYKEIAPKANRVLHEIMENPNSPAAVRVNVAQDFLDKAGYGQKAPDRDPAEEVLNVLKIIKQRAEAEGIMVGGNGKNKQISGPQDGGCKGGGCKDNTQEILDVKADPLEEDNGDS
jgi:hypothetical protein